MGAPTRCSVCGELRPPGQAVCTECGASDSHFRRLYLGRLFPRRRFTLTCPPHYGLPGVTEVTPRALPVWWLSYIIRPGLVDNATWSLVGRDASWSLIGREGNEPGPGRTLTCLLAVGETYPALESALRAGAGFTHAELAHLLLLWSSASGGA